jgi:hypothetical protein
MTQIAATTNAATAAQTARTPSSRATGASFAAVHTAAVQDAKDKDKTTSADSSAAPKGERTQKVDGHSYMEIVSGPRNGMFINNTGNKRDGEAFLIVKRHGREFHVYGTGADRSVYEVGRRRDATPAAGTNGTAGTGTTGTTGTGASTAPAGGTAGT